MAYEYNNQEELEPTEKHPVSDARCIDGLETYFLWDFSLQECKKKSIETIKSICTSYSQPSPNILFGQNCLSKFSPKANLGIQLKFADDINLLSAVAYSYLDKEGITDEIYEPFIEKFIVLLDDVRWEPMKKKNPSISKSKNIKLTEQQYLELSKQFPDPNFPNPLWKGAEPTRIGLVHQNHRRNIKVEADTVLKQYQFCKDEGYMHEYFFNFITIDGSNGLDGLIFVEMRLQGETSGDSYDYDCIGLYSTHSEIESTSIPSAIRIIMDGVLIDN